MNSLPERLTPENEHIRKAFDGFGADIRVAAPGIIEAFDSVTQTVTVRLSIREKIAINGKQTDEEIPNLVHVPVFMPRAGGYCLTLPISQGDECLVIFGDTCMDGWWQNGGVQNSMDNRRHDLSDGFAIVGIWSQPRKVSSYSGNSAQMRNEAGSSYVEIKGDLVNIVSGTKISFTAPEIDILGDTTIKVMTSLFQWWVNQIVSHSKTGAGSAGDLALNVNSFEIIAAAASSLFSPATSIDGKNFLPHVHTDPQGGNTGGVV